MPSTALLVLLILAIVLIVDVGWRLLLSGETRFNNFAKSDMSSSRVLFVYFPDILADGVTSSLKLVPIWQRHGDVMTVSYDGKRFKPWDIVRDTSMEITRRSKGYDTVVFIGSARGGVLSYFTYFMVEHLKKSVTFKFVLIDAATGRKDLFPLPAYASLVPWVWWAGPISNGPFNWFSQLYHLATLRASKKKEIEYGVDHQELAQRAKEANDIPISLQFDGTRSIKELDKLAFGSLEGVQVIYLYSYFDSTVRPEAYESWEQVAGSGITKVSVGADHAAYNQSPSAYQWAFERRIIPKLNLPG